MNEFSNHAVVFENLVRGEFHFDPASSIGRLESFRGVIQFSYLEDSLLLDRNGLLTRQLSRLSEPVDQHDNQKDALYLQNSFYNWIIFGMNVFQRGEVARSLEVLKIVQDDLLRMARILEGTAQTWITPTKTLEGELSADSYRRFQHCTSRLEVNELRAAYHYAWDWGNQMLAILAGFYEFKLNHSLIKK